MEYHERYLKTSCRAAAYLNNSFQQTARVVLLLEGFV